MDRVRLTPGCKSNASNRVTLNQQEPKSSCYSFDQEEKLRLPCGQLGVQNPRLTTKQLLHSKTQMLFSQTTLLGYSFIYKMLITKNIVFNKMLITKDVMLITKDHSASKVQSLWPTEQPLTFEPQPSSNPECNVLNQ